MAKYFRSLTFLFIGWLVLPALPVQAATGTERVVVTVIVASNKGNDFNLDNDAYRDRLIKLFSYSSYEQKSQVVVDLTQAEEKKLALPDGYDLFLTNQGESGGKLTVQAAIRKGAVSYLDTVLSILKPGAVFVGGPKAGGGVLILVLEAGV